MLLERRLGSWDIFLREEVLIVLFQIVRSFHSEVRLFEALLFIVSLSLVQRLKLVTADLSHYVTLPSITLGI